MNRVWVKGVLFAIAFFGLFGFASAAGTVSGTFQGPEGQTVDMTVRFKKGAETTVVNTVNGKFSQSLDPGEWSLDATAPPHPEYGAFTPFTISRLKIDESDAINLGNLPIQFAPPDSATQDLEEFPTKPAMCSDNGGPIIIRAYFTDEKKGNFIYPNRSTGVTVIADQAGYTVVGDYSTYEGNQPGTNQFSLTDNGDGTYTGSFTVTNTSQGGGMVILTVVGSGGATSRTCTDPGPYNLDIRTMLTGSDTTIFANVDDFRAIENFTMHVNGVVKITMRKPVNMLSTVVQRFFKSLAKTFESETGRMELNAAAAVQLQKAGAEVTFYNVPDQYLSAPEILLDGGAAGTAVQNVVYDRNTKTLTFVAAHFSEYKLAPKVTISSPTTGSTSETKTVTVKGTVNDLTSNLQFHVNGIDAGSTVPSSDGTYAKTVTLNRSGSNTISVVACNTSACSSSQSVAVTYSASTSTAASSSSTTSTTTTVASSSSSSSSTSTTLPKTGATPLTGLVALALVSVGGVLFGLGRRMRKARG